MSNIFIKGTAPFYPVPQHLVSSGRLKKLSEGAHKLYQVILFCAQKQTRAVLQLSNREIRDLAGLSPNTIRRGRTELWEARLVDLQRPLGGQWSYVVLNPLTGGPLPGSGLKRGGRDTETSSSVASSLPWTEFGR